MDTISFRMRSTTTATTAVPPAGAAVAPVAVPEPCMATLDRGLRITSADAALLEVLSGGAQHAVCGTPFTQHLHDSTRTSVLRRLERLVDGQDMQFRETSVAVVADDVVLHGAMEATAFSRDAGGVASIVVTLQPHRRAAPAPRPARSLTDTEIKILEGVAAGASTYQLAAELYLSRGGIEYHVGALLKKLNVRNRPALVSKAYAMGVFELGIWPPQAAPGAVA